MFLTIFYIYIVKVLDYTLLQYQSLLLLKVFNPYLILNGQTTGNALNLVPLVTLTPQDLQTSLLNILRMVPFGFGFSFITRYSKPKVIIYGALFSITIEVMQLLTGYLAKITFRVADVNDVIFNTLGVVIGFSLFTGFLHVYHRFSINKDLTLNPFLQYIADLTQIKK